MKNKKLINYIRNDIPLEFNELNVLKKHFSRVINIFNGNILPPYEILIHPSSICNLNCKWCIGGFVSSKKNSSELLANNLYDIDNMKKIVDSIISYKKNGYDYELKCEREFKVENVSFSGITGEPFMAWKSLKYAIDILTKEDIKVGIFTNGTLINEEMFPTLIKLKYLLISIDAGNSETYSKLKCNSKNKEIFNNLLDSISKLSDYKKENKSNLDINVGYIINQYNYNEIYDLAIKLKEIGVHYFRFKTDIASIMNLDESERLVAKEQIQRINDELIDDNFNIVEIHNVLDDNCKKRMHKKCFIHYLVGNISSDANVYPCNYHPKKDGYKYGSLLENDLSSIWNELLENEYDKQIPNICPTVCDPFKNRANYMLENAYEIYKENGYEYLKNEIDSIKFGE